MRKNLLAAVFCLGFFLSSGAHASSFLDLSKTANMGPEESFDEAVEGAQDVQKKNGLKDLPVGSQTFRGVPFQILDPSRNQGRSFVVLKGRRKPSFPEAVSISAGHLKAPYLYFLHTCRWGGTAQNITVAEYDVVYDDGLVTVVPLRVGMELANFFGADDTIASSLAWWHKYKSIEMGLNVFAWKNPRPEKSIQSILFKSHSKMPVPILFAVTASDKEIPLSTQSPKPEKTFQTDTSAWIPFASSAASPAGTAIDMSFLLDAPAGKHGKVKADGEKLVFEDGTEARFWGIRLADGWEKWDEEKTKALLDRLAMTGCNLVGVNPTGNPSTLALLLKKLKAKGLYLLVNETQASERPLSAATATQADPTQTDPAMVSSDDLTQGWALEMAGSLSAGDSFPLQPGPLVANPENGSLNRVATQRIFGKPFLAQWGAGWPNEYITELPLLWSSYASLEGWSGSLGCVMGDKDSGVMIPGDDLTGKPGLLAQWPTAALAYLRGDLKEGRIFVSELSAAPTFMESEMAARLKALAHRSGLNPAGGKFKTDAGGELKAKIQPKLKSLVSDTGQITWQGNVGVVKVESPRFQALVGFLGHRKFNNAFWSAETSNSFASLSAISLTKQPLSHSNHLLLTGVTRMENTGMSFNQSKTKLLSPGRAPILVEPLSAKIVLYRYQKDPALKVKALDANGQALSTKVPLKWVKNNLVLSWVPSAFYLEIFK